MVEDCSSQPAQHMFARLLLVTGLHLSSKNVQVTFPHSQINAQRKHNKIHPTKTNERYATSNMDVTICIWRGRHYHVVKSMSLDIIKC